MQLTYLLLVSNGIQAIRKDCEAESVFRKIIDYEESRRDKGTQCDKVNFQLHNLCSFILASTFKMR